MNSDPSKFDDHELDGQADHLLDAVVDHVRDEVVPQMPAELLEAKSAAVGTTSIQYQSRASWIAVVAALAALIALIAVVSWPKSDEQVVRPEPGHQNAIPQQQDLVSQDGTDSPKSETKINKLADLHLFDGIESGLVQMENEIEQLKLEAALLDARRKAKQLSQTMVVFDLD